MDDLVCVPLRWRGLPAQLIVGRELEIVVMTIGAHLACIRFRGEELNPLWQPHWPSADPKTVEPGGRSLYGPDPEAQLLAGIAGSNLCIDRFGEPWPGENKPLHGEAGISRFTVSQPHRDRVTLSAYLPIAHLHIERQFQLHANAVHLATSVTHGEQTPRRIEWCEHTTLGDPFLQGAIFSADVDLAVNWPGVPNGPSRFALIPPGGLIPVRDALEMPEPEGQPCSDVVATRAEQGDTSWTATNPRLRRRLCVRWDSGQFPWLALWTHNHGLTETPWCNRERTRGMELSTKPFPEGKPPHQRAHTFHQRSTVCSIPAGPGKEHAITLIWERL